MGFIFDKLSIFINLKTSKKLLGIFYYRENYFLVLILKNLSLCLTNKICFENFNATIYENDRIAIIGRNGAGKSTLLNMIAEQIQPDELFLIPQTIKDFEDLSGGERFIKKFHEAINKSPQFLLLDEPTNHLDSKNKSWLIKMINNYPGTVIFVSHDINLLNNCANTLWHIHDGNISVFQGLYEDYVNENKLQKEKLLRQFENIKRKQKEVVLKIQKEQENAARKKSQGEKKLRDKKWLKVVANQNKSNSENSQGKTSKDLNLQQSDLDSQIKDLFLPEEINFNFDFTGIKKNSTFSVINGSVGYEKDKPILQNLNITIDDNLAICGKNGSGKTTLLRALCSDEKVFRTGEWNLPKKIQYIDQHYDILDDEKNAIEIISETNQNLKTNEVRRFLSGFLFRYNEECNLKSKYLSGGERVRLALAKICCCPSELLILDEITNNIDLETREHVIKILKNYKNKFIVVSHDEDFLKRIDVKNFFYL